MTTTTITRVENRSSDTVTLVDKSNPKASSSGTAILPGTHLDMNVNVLWAASAADFPQGHLELQIGGQTRFWIWQAIWADGDQSNYVRFSQDGTWHDRGTPVFGVPAVTGPRTLVVQEDDCFQLVSYPDTLIAAMQQVAAGLTIRALCPTQPNPPPPPASVPKLSAVAFSMAGIPSDAFKKGVPGARFLYRDSGKRYEFYIDNGGVVHASGPDGSDIALTNAVSYTRKRVGEWTQQEQITLPPFDLIAANGGRVFAKAKGQDAFYFATMDHMFIGADDQGHEFVVPSTYFKLDPEFNQPGAQLADLLAPFRGCFADHPAAARFPLFRWLLAQNLNFADMMMISVQPQVWHLMDMRPPLGFVNVQAVLAEFAVQVLAQVQSILGPLQIAAPWTPFLDQLNTQLATWQAQLQQEQADLALPNPTNQAPPSWVPNTYPCVSYCAGEQTTTFTAVRYFKVLDIGVGHVHWHEQYESITGGELQPLRTGPLLPAPLPPVTYADLYRFANGPVSDGDGYIDGTCNFYALVQLKDDLTIRNDSRYRPTSGAGVPDSYALLYIDEQSYFTQRWRVVHPDDYKGLFLALVAGLNNDLPWHPNLYNWQPETYWCPFRVGLIGRRSRMAVSRQVLLVSGEDESGNAVLYSINFSYDSMDRTWRWRWLSDAAPVAYFPAGRVDAIVVNDDRITVRRSTSSAFDPNESWTNEPYYGSVGAGAYFADVDGDGKADAIVVNPDKITVRRSTDSAFGAYESWTNEPYYGSRGTYFADVDGDGRADAIVVNDDKITVRRSSGTAFGAYESWTSEPYYGSRGTYFADVDGDGRADAIVVNDDKITVRRSTGTAFGAYESWTSDAFFGSRGTYFADVDGDGKADAIAVTDTTVLVRRSTGSGFGPVEDWTHGAYYGSRGTYFADVTGYGAEVIPPTGGNCVYPQTVRLREDMTIHLKGRRQWGSNTPKVGRWYQRYLPATNELLPPAVELVPNTPPAASPSHAWKFLPEAVFQAADKFSHFGVYDTVDSRTQYYSVVPATAADVATLTSAGPGPWVDVAGKLYVRAWKFWWAAPLRLPDCCGPDAAGTADSLLHYEGRPERHPSIFNPDTLLRIEQRSGQWVALHWDKRDDDIMPFDGLPMQVMLQNGAAQVTVTLQVQQANNWIEEPPVVPLAAFVWTPTPGALVALDLTSLPFPPIWRVRMAALDASRPGGIVWLLDVEMQGNFTLKTGNVSEYSWTPTPKQAADLQRYCSSKAVAEQYGTSIWCEDIVGHVSVPEEIQWPLDTTPPTLHLPSTITTDATSPQGAVVNYTVTATDPDNTADQITITCTPASGSTFPIGTTTIQCNALDPTGNATTGSFQIIVKGAARQISDLIALVNSFNLSPKGIQTSFDSQLQAVQADLAANNTAQACSDLTSFINHVNAQSGKQLTTDQANELLATAKRIQAVLAC